ncbi:MAG: ferredoxin [Planctomycetota bacterium]|jgi:hypothetical protein
MKAPVSSSQQLAATPRGTPLSSREWWAWRTVQLLVWVLGLAMIVALVVVPDIGLHALWNVLIPVAPALLVFAPGLWRNICPLASTALFPRHMNWSRRLVISEPQRALLLLVGIVLLFLIVPFRHVVLDLNGPASAIMLVALAALALVMGRWFEWKSGWCSSLCPVHPVEKLYGRRPVVSPINAHCVECEVCISRCPDADPAERPTVSNGSRLTHFLTNVFMPGAFPGFVWGWFQVPDYSWSEGLAHLGPAYAYPLVASACTFAVYVVLYRVCSPGQRPFLIRAFAAAAVSAYYWYRLPALFGFGPLPGQWMLVDLTNTLPSWFEITSHIATTLLFCWWLLRRRGHDRAWLVRPLFANGRTA